MFFVNLSLRFFSIAIHLGGYKAMNAKSCAIIRAAREAQGLTQAGVAKLIHVDSDRYSAWERGTRDIPVDLLGDIARVLGVPVALIVHANVNPACIYASITDNPSDKTT